MIRTIFGVLLLGLAGTLFMFYTRPIYDGVQAAQGKSGQYDEALAKAAELQKLKQTLLSQYNSFNPNDIDRLQKLLPDHVDNVALILDFDNLASHFAMPLANVDVSTPASTANNQGSVSSIGGNGQKADSLTIKFSTQGTYPHFMQFLRGLEASLRVVDLMSLGMTRNAVASGAAAPGVVAAPGEPVFNYDVTLRTYWLK